MLDNVSWFFLTTMEDADMERSNGPQAKQLQLVFEADESRIWETLDRSQQDQVTEFLAKLWMEYVASQQTTPSSSSETSQDKS